MHDPVGFGSGNFLPRPFGVMSSHIIEMEIDTSKRLPPFAVAEIPFDVRQNRCTKELRFVLDRGSQSKKIVDAGSRLNNGNRTFFGMNFLCFSSRKSCRRWSPSRIIGVLVLEPRLIASL
jgi:hypothetical protein